MPVRAKAQGNTAGLLLTIPEGGRAPNSAETHPKNRHPNTRNPNLVCRAISAQFMDDSKIAIFELCLDDAGLVKTVEERHYQLVPADGIHAGDLETYRARVSSDNYKFRQRQLEFATDDN